MFIVLHKNIDGSKAAVNIHKIAAVKENVETGTAVFYSAGDSLVPLVVAETFDEVMDMLNGNEEERKKPSYEGLLYGDYYEG